MSVYEEKIVPRFSMIGYWVRKGCSVGEIAERLGISERTLKGQMKKSKRLRELIEDNMIEAVNARIEEAIIKKATGFTYTETKMVEKQSGTETSTTEKYQAPDMSAITYWNKYMCPERWEEQKQTERESAGGVVVLPELMEEDADDGTTK